MHTTATTTTTTVNHWINVMCLKFLLAPCGVMEGRTVGELGQTQFSRQKKVILKFIYG